MFPQLLQRTALVAAIISLASAQKQSIIPDDMKTGFRSGKEVQASYTGEAVNGFKDGTQFEKDAVTSEPTFALGDSSGVSPTTQYTIIMVDTTCPNARKLHYARPNFKPVRGLSLESESAALLDYQAPGAFGETGDNRQYAFFMYTNPQRRAIATLQMPAEGENFDIKQFQTDNSLPDPIAGVAMVVKLGGTADCGADTPNQVPETLPSPGAPQIPTLSRTGGAAPPAATTTAEATSGQQTDAPAPTATSAPSASEPLPENPAGPLPPPSTVATVPLASIPGGASPTVSGDLVQQTVNAAPGLAAAGGAMVAPMLAVAGVFLW